MSGSLPLRDDPRPPGRRPLVLGCLAVLVGVPALAWGLLGLLAWAQGSGLGALMDRDRSGVVLPLVVLAYSPLFSWVALLVLAPLQRLAARRGRGGPGAALGAGILAALVVDLPVMLASPSAAGLLPTLPTVVAPVGAILGLAFWLGSRLGGSGPSAGIAREGARPNPLRSPSGPRALLLRGAGPSEGGSRMSHADPTPHRLPPADPFPNSPLPLLVYRDVLPDVPDRASAFEALFARNGWTSAWRNGVYPFHHYHSTAHEVLGCTRGRARLRLGGPDGLALDATPGTVLVIPAGLAHCNKGSSPDFEVVGATDRGRDWDIRKGEPGEREAALKAIAALPLPGCDPVRGAAGPLTRLWRD